MTLDLNKRIKLKQFMFLVTWDIRTSSNFYYSTIFFTPLPNMNNDVHVHPLFGYCTSLVGVCLGFGTRSTLQPFDSQAQKNLINLASENVGKTQQIKVRVVNQS